MPPPIAVASMKVADLKRELRVRGLSTSGNKTELQERLQTVLDGEPLLEESVISGEELLDDDAVLSDEEKILNEHELLKSPLNVSTETDLMKSDGDNSSVDIKNSSLMDDELLEFTSSVTANTTTTSKKIVLKRKSAMTNVQSSANKTISLDQKPKIEKRESIDVVKKLKITEPNATVTLNSNGKQNDVKTIENTNVKKLTNLSIQERLEMRAKKFGVDANTQHLDTLSSSLSSSLTTTPVNDTKQIQILKKRAERFGCVTSTNLAKLDAEEKLLKRKQRFGESTSINTSGASSNDWAEKARKRLERFKTFSGASTKIANNTKVASN